MHELKGNSNNLGRNTITEQFKREDPKQALWLLTPLCTMPMQDFVLFRPKKKHRNRITVSYVSSQIH
jgi:hypothetical protein